MCIEGAAHQQKFYSRGQKRAYGNLKPKIAVAPQKILAADRTMKHGPCFTALRCILAQRTVPIRCACLRCAGAMSIRYA